MLILALESTTEACSVALFNNGQITEQFKIAPRQHTKLLLNMVDRILKDQAVSKNDLDAIAFCRGPGAFTGLRITTGVAQGLAYGLDLPLLPISSLATLAQGAFRYYRGKNNQFLSCLDARKNEVFWGFFKIEEGFARSINNEAVSPISVIPKALKELNGCFDDTWQVVGSGANFIQQLTEPKLSVVDLLDDDLQYPHAYDVALLAAKEYERGNTVQAEDALPVYLRNNVTY